MSPLRARSAERSTIMSMRSALGSWTLLLLAVAASGGTLAGAAQAGPAHWTSSEISFYSDLANTINGPAPPVLRPSQILLTEDGSIAIVHVRWASWGGAAARARGVLSASDCTPSCAQGNRTNSPARVTLSSIGVALGHRVYRCFQLTVPSHPKSDAHDCLEHVGKFIAYEPVVPSEPRPSHARFFTPSGNIACEMADNGTSRASVNCVMQKPPAIATLTSTGAVTICQRRGLKCTGNLGESPTPPRQLPYGHALRVGRFSCSSAFQGVTCTISASGRGFFISKQSVRQVG